jgi:hypothetical protein
MLNPTVVNEINVFIFIDFLFDTKNRSKSNVFFVQKFNLSA